MDTPKEMEGESTQVKYKGAQAIEKVKANYREFFGKMTREEKVNELRKWPDSQLSDFCERVALKTEDYEICEAVYIVKHERGLK